MQEDLVSLYDYLGYAAGGTLGKEVAEAAIKAKETIGKREINNTRYKGHVLLYRKNFLKEFFESRQK